MPLSHHRSRPRRPPALVVVAAAVVPALIIAAAFFDAPGDGAIDEDPRGAEAGRRPSAAASSSAAARGSDIAAGSQSPGLSQASGDAQETWTLVGAGDIAHCDVEEDAATAALVEAIEGTVFTAGDNAYPHGSAGDFADCYGPTWGRFRERTRPALGSHEYDTPGAAAYFDFFGENAGPPGRGYYSYQLGRWLVLVLNTNCGDVGDGCDPESAQVRWLRAELLGADGPCVVAISGHPRFSSGAHGDDRTLRHLFKVLHDERVELLISGHDHDYERLAPLDPDGFVDQERGVRQFVVGTGGRSLRPFDDPRPGSEVAQSDAFGVLRLTLRPTDYQFAFLGTDGRPRDEGSGTCH